MNMRVLCFEVWKDEKKLALAGVRESGVVSVILSWVGRGPGASGLAAAAKGRIPDLRLHVGALDSSDPGGDEHVSWIEEEQLAFRLGDEIRIGLTASEAPDVPVRTEPSKPISSRKDGAELAQCSFCSRMRKTAPAPVFYPGVMGANVFICTRCLVLAERLLDDGLTSLFHLSRAADQACSFCAGGTSRESATAGDASVCRGCADMILKDA
jgi:hypothetical protein